MHKLAMFVPFLFIFIFVSFDGNARKGKQMRKFLIFSVLFGVLSFTKLPFPLKLILAIIPIVIYYAIPYGNQSKSNNYDDNQAVGNDNNHKDPKNNEGMIIDMQTAKQSILRAKRDQMIVLSGEFTNQTVKKDIGDIVSEMDKVIILFDLNEDLSQKYEKIINSYTDYLINSLITYKSIESMEHSVDKKEYVVNLAVNIQELLKDIKSVFTNIVLLINENRAAVVNADLDAIRQDMRMRGLID